MCEHCRNQSGINCPVCGDDEQDFEQLLDIELNQADDQYQAEKENEI